MALPGAVFESGGFCGGAESAGGVLGASACFERVGGGRGGGAEIEEEEGRVVPEENWIPP